MCRAQFMTGDALLVSPILHWNVVQAPAYFPPGRWYSLYDYAPVDAGTYGLNSTVRVRTAIASLCSIMSSRVFQQMADMDQTRLPCSHRVCPETFCICVPPAAKQPHPA